MRFPHALLAAAAFLIARPASAQQVTIDPGMSKTQVVERLGKPAGERTRGTFTYLFYANGVERQVGTADIVVLDDDKVVDAIFRAPNRAYSGTSSSPRAVTATEARAGTQPPKTGSASRQ